MSKFNSNFIDMDFYYKRIADDVDGTPRYQKQERRVIVCLCGSTRFREQFEESNRRETLSGRIVLSVGCFVHDPGHKFTTDQKRELDELHLEKIDLADEVLVLNVGGYVGESTRREVMHAHHCGKVIRWLEPSNVPFNLSHIGSNTSCQGARKQGD